ncbi:DNRLRE domain-containing protein [Plantactinospora mayteni]|uniref:DNRLRE domain-containing protein n=1 Tax=Plantactinospora mayteni TaxID=566021 RepID=UPI001EF738D8|nr:DNRLRE domain-containing protein [Plantactinospora mayteni]
MAGSLAAVVRSCLALATAAALIGVPGEPARYLAAGPDGVSGGVPNRSDEARSLRVARESGAPVQVNSLTSETTQVWALPDGQFRAEIASGVQRFRRGADWIPVDLSLRPSADGTVQPAGHPNGLRIAGARGTGEHELAAIGGGDNRVAMLWSGALPTPTLDGHRATYVDALPGVDLVVEATRLGFEQFLLVKTRAAIERVTQVRFPLTGSGVAASRREPDGAITLTDRAGTATARIPAPLMWDAKRDITGAPASRRPVRTDVTERGDRVELTLTPDRAWLRNPSTAFPVTIDPTVNPLGTTFDTYVRETVNTDQNQEPDLQIGLLATTPPTLARSFITWDTTVLAGKQINSATVSLWNFWSHTCTPTSWEIWSTDPSTYSTRFTSQPTWHQQEATSLATHGSTDCVDAWATIDGKSFFQRAATAGSTRAGMGIRATDETVPAGFKQFRSREGGVAAEAPKASVTYNSWPTVTARATVPASTCATGAGRPLVNTLTPQLRATVSDGDGTAMSVTFEWWAMNASVPIGTSTFTGVASGATASVTVPVGAFVEGGTYRWRVKAADGVAGSDVWSSFCEMTVYVTAPPAVGCAGSTESDFNGDGVADIAIADPEATVNGFAKAGQIHVSYGGTGAVQTLHENNARVSGGAEAGDGFGTSISSYDANNDGCTDLAVGVPYEDLNNLADVGVVYLLLGSPAGLTMGPASLTYHQDVGSTPDALEAEDWFGYSVAGGRTASGEPYLLIGAPGEDLGTAVDAGLVHYLRGAVNVVLDQAVTGSTDSNETDDRFGYSVTGSAHHIAAGRPGETTPNGAQFAGAITVYSHELVSGRPKWLADKTGGAGFANANYGKSVAVASYRPTGAPIGQPDSFLLVGEPGADVGTSADAGKVHRYHLTATGASGVNGVTEGFEGLAGQAEEGDYFGERVFLVNTAPDEVATAQTLLAAVGAPGQDIAGTPDAGLVQIFGGAANPNTGSLLLQRGGTLPGSPTGRELLGLSLGGSSQHLYLASPYGDGSVAALAWSDLVAGLSTPVRLWRPGEGGLPADEVAFGAAIG